MYVCVCMCIYVMRNEDIYCRPSRSDINVVVTIGFITYSWLHHWVCIYTHREHSKSSLAFGEEPWSEYASAIFVRLRWWHSVNPARFELRLWRDLFLLHDIFVWAIILIVSIVCIRERGAVARVYAYVRFRERESIIFSRISRKEMKISLSPNDRRWIENRALGRHLAILARINWSLLRMKMCYLFSEYVFMNARRVGSQSFARAFVFSFLLLTICSPTLLIYNNYRINRTVSFRVVKCC